MECKIIFEPEGREVFALPGTSVIEAAARAELIIDSPCGGKGICGKCRIKIKKGDFPPTDVEKRILSKDELNEGVRLACQSMIKQSSVVYIPKDSRFSSEKIITHGVEKKREIKPSVWKVYLELPAPTLKSQKSDMQILRENIKQKFRTDIYIIRKFSRVLRENDFKVTCVFSDSELISVEKGDTTAFNYGLAFDIGTSTIVGTLLDILTGEDMAVAARVNPQIIHGDDVISRINYTMAKGGGLDELHYLVIKIINEMVGELCKKTKVNRENIYKMAVAGNSTMEHIFMKVSPENLGSIPFSLVVDEGVEVKAKKLGIEINPDGTCFVFPNIAGFVGGDTVAGILASDIFESKDIKLLVDIGTNGEIVLGNRTRLIAASTAAGPAFEGARISQGMRASSGAIEKVIIEDDVIVNVIGDAPPSGICGSGIIDAVSEMLRLGIISKDGRILSKEEVSGNIPDAVLSRIVTRGEQNDFLLAKGVEKPIYITQRDVREVQLAKGGIKAGIKILKKILKIEDKDIKEILLAGAFGNFIRRSNAKRIGLVPGLPSEKIKFIGNAASSGAKLVLLSENLERKTERISKRTEYIELSTRSDFQEEFVEAMGF